MAERCLLRCCWRRTPSEDERHKRRYVAFGHENDASAPRPQRTASTTSSRTKTEAPQQPRATNPSAAPATPQAACAPTRTHRSLSDPVPYRYQRHTTLTAVHSHEGVDDAGISAAEQACRRADLIDSLREWQGALDLKLADRAALTVAVASVRTSTSLGRRGVAGSVLPRTPQADERVLQHRLSLVQSPVSDALASMRSDESTVSSPGEHAADAMAGAEWIGEWSQTRVDNLDEYLKALGTSWAKRKIAGAFKPDSSWAIVDGVLQVLTPTPIGNRLERFVLSEPQQDADPYGVPFTMTSSWQDAPATRGGDSGRRDGMLVVVGSSSKGVFVTRRYLEGPDIMIQTTTAESHGGISFTRTFQRKVK